MPRVVKLTGVFFLLEMHTLLGSFDAKNITLATGNAPISEAHHTQ